MARLIIIAEKPRIIIRSLKKGKAMTVPLAPATCFFASILFKTTNNKKQRLQINVNFDKNEINFIKMIVLKKLSAK
mgnify:CR=1 FL=1